MSPLYPLLIQQIVYAKPILLTLLLSFGVLNLAGPAPGKVARLWIFWVPMVIWLASLEIEKWVQKKSAIVWILAVTGFTTILLT